MVKSFDKYINLIDNYNMFFAQKNLKNVAKTKHKKKLKSILRRNLKCLYLTK